jgi:hypothetical protein
MPIIRKSRLVAAALAASALIATPAMAAEFRAILSADNLLTAGDSDGWGRARVRVNDTFDRLCADLEVRSIGEVTAAQIHRGAEGEDGPPVANLDRPDGDDNDSDDCDRIGEALADEIQSNPAGFYVLIRTSDFPQGALRGQLIPTTG